MAKFKASRRGNMTIELGGEERLVRPSFSAMLEFEETSGYGAYEALRGLQGSKINSKMIVSAIWAGIRGAHPSKEDTCPSWREVGEMCFEKGMAACIGDALKFLTLGLAGATAAEEVINEQGKPLSVSPKEED